MDKETLVLLLFVISGVRGQSDYPVYHGVSSVNVHENKPPGTQVFNFTVSDPEDDPLTVTINFDSQFQLSMQPGGLYIVRLKQLLDRETENRYAIKVSIDDSRGHQITKDVTVRVQDLNDYTPVFNNIPLIANVKENQPAGTYVLNITVEDEDRGYNAATEIFLLDHVDKFYLGDFSTRSAVEHSYQRATVLLTGPLDYETDSAYTVGLRVVDMAGCSGDICQPPLSSEQKLRVNILDAQDTPPHFTGGSFWNSASTEENLPPGTAVLTVSAVDGDTDNRRDIEYFLSESDGSPFSSDGYFQIDQSTGVISNRVVIDTDSQQIQQTGSTFSLTVIAREKVRDGELFDPVTDEARTAVTISVIDTNDQRPQFSAEFAEAEIKEGLPPGSPVQFRLPLKVTDTDQGVNGVFSLQVLGEDNSPSPWFSVPLTRVTNEVIVSLVLTQTIDYEMTQSITVKVSATEVESSSVSYCTVRVNIADVNDNSPQFSQRSYTFDVSELAGQGEVLTPSTEDIVAVDEDSGFFGNVTYSIQGSQSWFAIDPVTGRLSLTCDGCLDREATDTYYLNILATDGGGLTDTAQVIIYVGDVNDNAPTFTSAVYMAEVDENLDILVDDVTILAADEDINENGRITFSVLNFTESVGIFDNGSIYIISPIDAEQQGTVLSIGITATDGGEPALSATCLLKLQIRDLNDNPPSFIQGSTTLSIPESTPSGQIVYTVETEDKDITSPNNLVSYSLSNSDGTFIIDSQSGDIRLTRKLDADLVVTDYELTVIATDRGSPALSQSEIITIQVTDVNDETPRFSQDSYVFYVEENAPVGFAVADVVASDPDSTKLLTYQVLKFDGYQPDGEKITLNEPMFEINADNGTLTVAGELDRETVARVLLWIQVEDTNGVNRQTSNASAEFVIRDVNDNVPVIQPVGTLEVTETNSVDETDILTQLKVVDSDLSSEFEFSISSNPDGAFNVDSNGNLRLIKPVDRETTGNWMNITIVVYDSVSNGLSSSIDIPVAIQDVNDNAPEFQVFESQVVVTENVTVGSTLTQVEATDADFDAENREVHYEIQSGSQGRVEIDGETGVLRVAEALDRETEALRQGNLSLTIRACDRGRLPLCQSRTMVVLIKDINDNSPRFSQQLYTARISETAQQGDIAVMGGETIRATDADPTTTSVEYSCCEPGNDTNNLFSLNSEGQIVVATKAGLLEMSGVYQLSVTASDSSSPARSSVATVIVDIEDFNNHSPVLRVDGDIDTTVNRPESSPEGTVLIEIAADDGDKGVNADVEFHFVVDDPTLSDYRHFLIAPTPNKPRHAVIKQNVVFDRENRLKPYKFGIIAKDKGVPSLSSSPLVITVVVDDVNDNDPYFPVSSQQVKTTVREEEPGISIGSFDLAQDNDERNIFCYYIVGARNSEASSLPAQETVIRRLFTIDPQTANIRLLPGQKLDRERQNTYVLVLMADDRDENVYSQCQSPSNTPWVSSKTKVNEMELVIQVEDVNDNPPEFSNDLYTTVVVRNRPAPITLINLKEEVSDIDVDQEVTFSQDGGVRYDPERLSDAVSTSEPVMVYSDGKVNSQFTFTSDMEGSFSLGVVAMDAEGHQAEAMINVIIAGQDEVALFTVSRDLHETQASQSEFISIFKSHANWNVSIVSMKVNQEKKEYTDVEIYVVRQSGPRLTSKQILQQADQNSELITALYRYGFVDSKPAAVSSVEEEPKVTNVTVVVIILVVILLIIIVTVGVVCYIMRNKYKRKLKAAHAMAFDTHTLGFEIDHGDVTNSVNNVNGSASISSQSGTPRWNNDNSLNNFDWTGASNAFESESHRSSHSVDDNAIDPLNEAETQSCSSAGSNDWRLDLRGNNLDCSPPPPITDDVIDAILIERNNQLNCEGKFNDSSSDRSSSNNTTKDTNGHFNRLIMSDSVYGKVYETRRMPNGLETTEV